MEHFLDVGQINRERKVRRAFHRFIWGLVIANAVVGLAAWRYGNRELFYLCNGICLGWFLRGVTRAFFAL